MEAVNLRAKNRSKKLGLIKRYIPLYIMLLFPIVSTFIFHYVPFYGIQIAFKNYRASLGIWGSEWVGLKHFSDFISHPYFWQMLRNTLLISVCSLITFPCPVILTIMLNELRSNKLRKFTQLVTYAPHFISVVVVCSITLMLISEDGGLLNIIIRALGGQGQEWIAKKSAFIPIYVISGLWQNLGWSTIIYVSAMAGIPLDRVEAAQVDGAGRLRVIWHIYLPHLKPTIITMFIMNLGHVLSVGFEKIFLLQNPLNMEVSRVISTYSYSVGILGGEYSYSTAIGLFNNIINIIMIVAANFITKKVSNDEYGLW